MLTKLSGEMEALGCGYNFKITKVENEHEIFMKI
jgi:hypothetical protein